MTDPTPAPPATPCSLQPPADYEPDAATALALLNGTDHESDGEPDHEDAGARVESLMSLGASHIEQARAAATAPAAHTVVFGPWANQDARDRTFGGMTADRRARARKARWGGRYFIEVWPAGTALGQGGISRAWPPKAPALPPLAFLSTPNESSRDGAKVDGIVLHETEGGYLGAVSWLRQSRAQASAHLVVREDGGHATQLVPFGEKAWHAVNANSYTIGIELAGFTAAPNDPAQLATAARIVACLCRRFGIAVRRSDEHGHGGIGTHRQLGVFGGGHHDPGGFDVDGLITAAAREFTRGGFAAWGR